ncbi:hypothetical protein [Lactococcus lactis]|uniref:Uncharacterized protein n=1 Tax=Lactococcus lactis subsp. lactis TaxID=1360 RepID=A0A2N5WB63_LACLL|nr:hypothetical protein [Lactococcus lactis]PLW59458.1 hypothetical protein CYU10_000321 [Lactococcus lactis subsp. lactis]
MSDKKYYVRLAEAFQPGGKYLVQLGFNGSNYYFDRYKGSAAENYNQNSFTKSELGKIMDGAIYKGCVLPDGHEFSSDCKPWINPLIELVPVEDRE